MIQYEMQYQRLVLYYIISLFRNSLFLRDYIFFYGIMWSMPKQQNYLNNWAKINDEKILDAKFNVM